MVTEQITKQPKLRVVKVILPTDEQLLMVSYPSDEPSLFVEGYVLRNNKAYKGIFRWDGARRQWVLFSQSQKPTD